MGKRIVIVGAGYAGILTAKKLAKKFKKNNEVEITIIDRNPFHTMLTELHEVAASRVDEESIRIDLKKVFAGRKVDVKLDSVETIDFVNKVVVGKNEQYSYDYVVVAAGSKPTFFGIEGAKENTFTLWSYDDAVVLRDHIHDTFLAASKESDIEKRRHLLTFYVVGAGFTGVEMIGELAEYVPVLCHKHSIDRSEVTLVNVDAMSRTVPVLPEKLSNKVERRLEKMGVKVVLNAKVCLITNDSIELDTNGECVRYGAHTVIWTAGIESADITTASGKSIEASQRGGRIATDAYLRAVGKDNVFVVGDNMYYVVEGGTLPVPQMVENAEHSAGTCAHNIAQLIKGSNDLEEYKPSFHGMMVCIGGRYGVARVGFPKFMFNLPSFLAMLSKHFINIVYFVQVLGWNKVFSYVKHEFFTIRNKRSFVGGHFSNRSPSVFLVPLRIWLGLVWVFEGVHKYLEGWVFAEGGTEPKLEQFFGWANDWYDSLLNGSDGAAGASGSTDAAAGATGSTGGETAGEVLLNFNFLGLFQTIFVTGTTLEASTLADFAFKLDIPLMNWFVDTVILSSDGMQIFMQGAIVIMEVLIGLALIAGLFTTLSAFASVVLQFMFLTTTGWYLSTVWMVVAGIALLFGGGQSLSFDYYVIPWLKSKWRKIPFIKKWYLYHD